MDQPDARGFGMGREQGRGPGSGNPGQRPPQWNPRPNPPRPPRPEPPRPRPPRPIPVPLPRPVENVISVNNAIVIEVDVTAQFSTVLIAYEAVNAWNQIVIQRVRLVITNETVIRNQFGQIIGAWGLRPGMRVNARFSSRFTFSEPPQAVAFSIRIVAF